MEQRSTTYRRTIGLGSLGAIAVTVTLGVGWWLGYRATERAVVSPQDSVSALRAENNDLIRFIDEAYLLLREEGIHIQLDLEMDEQGRYRLRADSAKLTDELRARMRALQLEHEGALRTGPVEP